MSSTTEDSAADGEHGEYGDQPGSLELSQLEPAGTQMASDTDEWEQMFDGLGDDDDQRWGDLDVRAVIAQLPRDRAPRLDDVDWGRFKHTYGSAVDVPVLLTRLADPDPAAASEARGELWNNLRHQGNSSMAAPLAVPFLIRLAADPDVHHRWDLLDLAAEIGRRNAFGDDSRTGLLRAADDEELCDNWGYPGHWSIQAGRDALAADTGILLSLLHDPDPHVRCRAAYALAAASGHPAEISDGLRQRLGTEDEPSVRISLLLGIAQTAGEHHHQLDETTGWLRGLWSDPAQPQDVRLGAGIAWLCLTDVPPPDGLLDLLADAVTPEAAEWMRYVPWPDDIDGHGGLGAWLVGLVGGDTALTFRLARSAQPQARIGAIRAGYHIAVGSRSATDEIVAATADLLGDPSRAVALVAARYLGRVGAATAPVAAALAAALDHEHEEVRAWAAVGLAHCGDRRAVAPLIQFFGQDCCPWPSSNAYGADLRPPVRLLDALRPHAGELLPALTHRLGEGGDGWTPAVAYDLVRGLGRWGPDAGPAARAIATFLLRGPVDVTAVATALGRIGPAAADLIPVLDPPPASADDISRAVLAWACWRISGERTANTIATLTRAATTPPYRPRGLAMLADLGLAAHTSVDTVRSLLADIDPEVRTEAAHALWRITSDHTDALPVLVEVLHRCSNASGQTNTAGVTTIGYLGDIGQPAPDAIPILQAILQTDRRVGGGGAWDSGHDQFTWDHHVQHVAAHTLTRIQHATTD